MKAGKIRTKDDIFAAMHRELRTHIEDVPEAPERLDPILRLMLELYADQLAGIEGKLGRLWQEATDSLIRSLIPDCKRWPVPAYTIVKCDLTDPIVDVDENTKIMYREEREGGKTFYFTPRKQEHLIAAELRHIIVKCGETAVDIADTGGGVKGQSRKTMAEQPQAAHIGFEYEGEARYFSDIMLYLHGDQEAVDILKWSRWLPLGEAGYDEKEMFVPGTTPLTNRILGKDTNGSDEWGGFRSHSDLYGTIEKRIVAPPEGFTSAMFKQHAPDEIGSLAFAGGIDIKEPEDGLFWFKVLLPDRSNKSTLLKPLAIYTNCFIAFNRNDRSVFKHTAGNKLVELELTDHIDSILEIVDVTDSDGDTYVPIYEAIDPKSDNVYSMEERDNRILLWFDYNALGQTPPDSITVLYTVTEGTRANGIEAGKIVDLYEQHPGIDACMNLVSTAGAIPAKSVEQVVDEATVRLRSRDRAMGFSELETWARTFDPRIVSAVCRNSTDRTNRGVRRCIAVEIGVKPDSFHSDDELEFLKYRLARFLKSRAPVNSQFRVEVAE